MPQTLIYCSPYLLIGKNDLIRLPLYIDNPGFRNFATSEKDFFVKISCTISNTMFEY